MIEWELDMLICSTHEAFFEVNRLATENIWKVNDEDICKVIDELIDAGMMKVTRIQGTNKYSDADMLPVGKNVFDALQIIEREDMHKDFIDQMITKGGEHSIASVCDFALSITEKHRSK